MHYLIKTNTYINISGLRAIKGRKAKAMDEILGKGEARGGRKI
jgi:hypothetical protein